MNSDLMNIWYVAAISTELTDAPVARKICDRPVVLFRMPSGDIGALADRCPHRFVPLSLGRVCEGQLVCGYHGLAFDSSGRCVDNPQGTVTRSLNIPAYRSVERYGLIWLWMGDPDLADPDAIPDFALLDDPAKRPQYGYLWTAAHFELVSDNILDLSHIEFLHADTLGTDKIRQAKTQAKAKGDTIFSIRTVNDEVLPAFMDQNFETGGRPVTRTLCVRWNAPALMLLTVSVDPAGPEGGLRETFNMHFVTPESATTCHYFWAATRPYGPDDPERDRRFRDGLERAFKSEDKPMIEAQQLALGDNDLLAAGPALFKGDSAAIQARRVLRKMREKEAKLAGPELV